jgi:hypothetical protein
MSKFKLEAISFAQTFVTLFVIDIALAFAQIPADQVLSGEVFTGAVLVGIVSAAARSALKVAWEKFLPKALGGKKKS